MVTDRQSRNLDVLRAFAVTSVFVGHIGIVALAHSSYLVGSAARFGVMAFFVHTALVLMQSLQRLHADSEGSVTTRFYLRRLLRIYPLSIVCVLALVAFHIPTLPWRAFAPPTGRVLASNLLLIQNLTLVDSLSAPLWSLPFEVQMYLVLPFCYLAIRRWNVNPLVLAGLAALACVPVFPVYMTDLLRYFPCFLTGVAAYKFSDSRKGRYPAHFFILFLALNCGLYTFGRAYLLNHAEHWLLAVYASDWLCSLAIGLALPYFREIPDGWLSNAAHQVAKYSYGIYLSHLPLMWLTRVAMDGKPLALRLAVFLIGTVAVPVLAFHLLESPGIQLGKRLSDRLRRSPKLAIPYAA